MSHSLKVVLTRTEGVLVRVLGVAVRRGYEPVRVLATPVDGNDIVELEMTVESERSADLLARQLARLYEVRDVEVLS